jgi:diguanylate cyclase (GGDEF)-like protein
MDQEKLLNVDTKLRIETARISNFLKHSKVWLIVFLLCVGLTPPVSFWLYYSVASSELQREFYKYVQSISVIAASQIDPIAHARMVAETGENGPEFQEILETLVAIQRKLPDIRYMNSMIILDNEGYMLTDTAMVIKEDSEGNPLIPSEYMEKYNTIDEEDYIAYAALSNGEPYTFSTPYTDDFGSFVGSCAPLDAVPNAHPSMVCVDIAASEFYEDLAQIKKQFIYTSTLTALLCLFIFFSVTQYQTRISRSFKLLENQRDLFLMNAHSDPLTGALNRRSLDLLFKAAVNQVRRKEANYCLIALDIDHFKLINDTYGHDNGDLVLIETVKALKASLRAHDHVARMGGEEFVVLSIFNDDNSGLHTAEKIRLLIEELDVVGSHGERIKFTTSIGIHLIRRHDTLESAMKAADKALYRAKQNGRNQVIISSDKDESDH